MIHPPALTLRRAAPPDRGAALVATLVFAGLLAGAFAPAQAQTRSWVDPPARSRTPAPTKPEPKPAAPDPAAPRAGAAPDTPSDASSAAPAAPPAVVVAPDATTARPDVAAPATAPAVPAPAVAKAPAAPAPATRVARRGTTATASPSLRRRAARAQRHEAHEAVAAAEPLAGDLTPYAAAARALTLDYLAAMSGPRGVVADSLSLYAPHIVFHGRPTTRAALFAEKQRFVARWPERRYRPLLTDLRIACNAALGTCIVRTPFDFAAESPARGARSRGLGMLVLGVQFTQGRPRIASEASRVIARDLVARAAPSIYGRYDEAE